MVDPLSLIYNKCSNIRSHAGIKAFICQICNTSFTRQHSLNYHMLIHNGQSRFTCDACGRQFRHPQHYKVLIKDAVILSLQLLNIIEYILLKSF